MYIDILNLEIEDSTYVRMKKYLEILMFWQKSLNLISKDTIADAWQRHFLDSLQLLPVIKSIEESHNWQDKPLNIFDLGSGAGFPGLVLAIVDTKNQYYLIESNSKKTAFLAEVVRVVGLNNVVIINQRIKDFATQNIKADIITSRGLTKLDSLVVSLRLLGEVDSVGLFLKGQNYQQEIEDLKDKNQDLNLKISTKPSLINNDSRIIVVNS
ncbi:MAG: 16S rRNA (guanine(527)-N(7))-methyltransferase RsmG [Alphaproteobacteria bacterium]|jgi:16S rRNA (guanine527-N7)-methyltransferase|nr:16S rRNA (guanine(527)-N(7))-methyltransferase RsmG [Alphaproteobacteria bacterium]